MARTSRQHRHPRAAAPRVGRLLSFLGFALSVQSTPAAAQVTAPVPPSPGGRVAAPPWSGVGGKSPLPPTRARVTPPPVRHPAIHPAELPYSPGRPLFPRAGDLVRQKNEREAAMKRHPAGKGLKPAAPRPARETRAHRTRSAEPRTAASEKGSQTGTRQPESSAECGVDSYRVRPADSLWSVSASISGPAASASQLAELTDQIFEMNRHTIGDDPDLIHPGQSLSLPKDCSK